MSENWYQKLKAERSLEQPVKAPETFILKKRKYFDERVSKLKDQHGNERSNRKSAD